MEEIESKNYINALENRVKKLEDDKGKKDVWDVISIITSFLIPISIFFAGLYFSKAERDSKLANQQKEIQLAEIKSKVDQAQLVAVFLEALVDTNAYKRQLAIKSILLALPEKGEEIVKTISEKDPDENVKNYAKKSLTDSRNIIRTELIQKIFDREKQTRITATNELIQNWKNDAILVNEIISYANGRLGAEPENMSGIINTIVVLNNVDISVISEKSSMVKSFINTIEQLEGRDQTKEYLENLKKRVY